MMITQSLLIFRPSVAHFVGSAMSYWGSLSQPSSALAPAERNVFRYQYVTRAVSLRWSEEDFGRNAFYKH
jgi:hypothetical protein